LSQRLFVELDDGGVVSADDQQRGGTNARQFFARQIGTTSTRHDGSYTIGAPRRRHKRRATTRARPEQADRERTCFVLCFDPAYRADQALGEETDIEAQLSGPHVDLLFAGREKVE
jgi:hypothetical protein